MIYVMYESDMSFEEKRIQIPVFEGQKNDIPMSKSPSRTENCSLVPFPRSVDILGYRCSDTRCSPILLIWVEKYSKIRIHWYICGCCTTNNKKVEKVPRDSIVPYLAHLRNVFLWRRGLNFCSPVPYQVSFGVPGEKRESLSNARYKSEK